MYKIIATGFLAFLIVTGSAFAQGKGLGMDPAIRFLEHNIDVKLNVAEHKAELMDSGRLNLKKGFNVFQLNKKAEIKSFTINGEKIEYLAAHEMDLPSSFDEAFITKYQNDDAIFIYFEYASEGTFSFMIEYDAVFHQDVENMRFSNEMVGNEVTGTILDQGAYLSGGSFFYPQGKDLPAMYSLEAHVPPGWLSISDGNQVDIIIGGDETWQKWENPYLSDGIVFMAAPYVIKSMMVDSTEIFCYFFEEDTTLFDGYLEATVGYIEMYNELIGPYPYQRFTVAENFFPTGYGMPGWTLLGQQVLQLPFIKFTSLGHEVLHNWWGNSVYVDYKRGNWCESATVYGADYRYKLQQSEDAAKAYRKDILKQYVSYINEGNDFPIRDFKSRTSPGTRTIGYNKAMMVYHMIEKEIGSEPFWQTWKNIYSKFLTKQISWEEWIDEFTLASGADLSHIIPDWINQPGAPELTVGIIASKTVGDLKEVTFKLSEKSDKDFNLFVPLRFSGVDFVEDKKAYLNSKDSTYTISVPLAATSLTVDPDYHLFRKLYPEEIEPIISAFLGEEAKAFVSSQSNDLFKEFAVNMDGDSVALMDYGQYQALSIPRAPLILNPEKEKLLFDYQGDNFSLTADSMYLMGKSYPRQGHTFVFSYKKSFGDLIDKNGLAIITDDYAVLPRLGQLIPHYGKYSYLVFEGTKNIAKGQWNVTKTPLRVEF